MKVGDIVLAKPDSDRAYCCTCFQKCFVGKIIYVEETRITVSGLHNLPNFEGSSLPFIVQKKYFVVANPKSLKFLEKHLEKRDYDFDAVAPFAFALSKIDSFAMISIFLRFDCIVKLINGGPGRTAIEIHPFFLNQDLEIQLCPSTFTH